MTDVGGGAAGQLRAFVERIERLEAIVFDQTRNTETCGTLKEAP